jgi:hypothetical protein
MSNRLELGLLDLARIGIVASAPTRTQGSRLPEQRRAGSLAQAADPADEALPYFFLSYELGADWSAEDYKELYGVLRSFRSWTWLLDSVWVLQASSADAVRDMVAPLLGETDRLLVMEVSKPAEGSLPAASPGRGGHLAERLAG